MSESTTKEALEVDQNLEDDFEEARQHELTDDDIKRAELLLGVDTASKYRELYGEGTPDAIRNSAVGVGDDNPHYVDENYGPTTRWGSQIAHGTMTGRSKPPRHNE